MKRRIYCAINLLLLATWGRAEVRSLTILHTNDIHARLTPLDNGEGGFAYLAAVIRREREGCNDCILLNGGDLVQGSPVSTIFHGEPVFELGNLFGFDASTLGNHEFDYGWEQARKFMEIAKYPLVSANIVGSNGELFASKAYVILNVNGLRVAVIGAETDELQSLTTPKLLGQWHTIPVIETVKKYASELRSKSDLVVLVAHIGPEEEKQVLKAVPDIQVTVSGHLHSGMKEPLTSDGRILVRVKGYGQELGKLTLKVDTEKKAAVDWKWKKIEVNSKTVTPAADMARGVEHWEHEVSGRVDKPLAVSDFAFTLHQVKLLIERALRDETHSDFAFMNEGGVRDIVPKGQLQIRNIWNIMPFDNKVVVGTFKGSELPAVVVGHTKIDPEREYTLAVSDFTAANQEAKGELRSTGLKFPRDAGLMRDLLIDWFRKKKVIRESDANEPAAAMHAVGN